MESYPKHFSRADGRFKRSRALKNCNEVTLKIWLYIFRETPHIWFRNIEFPSFRWDSKGGENSYLPRLTLWLFERIRKVEAWLCNWIYLIWLLMITIYFRHRLSIDKGKKYGAISIKGPDGTMSVIHSYYAHTCFLQRYLILIANHLYLTVVILLIADWTPPESRNTA